MHRAARATGPRGAVLDERVRALPAVREGAGGGHGGDVLPGSLHAQGEGGHGGANLPLPRQGGSRDRLRAHLHAPQEDQHLNRDGRPAARHQGGRRRHLARQLHAP